MPVRRGMMLPMRRLKRSLTRARASWRRFPPLLFVALIASLVLVVFAFSGGSNGGAASLAKKSTTTTTPPVTNAVPFKNPHMSVRARAGGGAYVPHRIQVPHPIKKPIARKK